MTKWLLFIRKNSACAFYKKLKMIDFWLFTSLTAPPPNSYKSKQKKFKYLKRLKNAVESFKNLHISEIYVLKILGASKKDCKSCDILLF